MYKTFWSTHVFKLFILSRSESFKEDKDVLLSKLKLFKPKDDRSLPEEPELLPRSRRKSSRSDDSLEEEKGTCKPKSDSLKSRAAVFEQTNQRLTDYNNKNNIQSKVQEFKNNFEKCDDFVRKKEDDVKNERRRHTFESRERESEERLRRVSLESPR